MRNVAAGASRPTLVLGACLCIFAAAGKRLAADSVNLPASSPSTRPDALLPADAAPIDPASRALAAKLGDDDPAVREEATRQLTQMGKAAMPALRDVAAGDGPEASARAKALIRHLERRLPPAGPVTQGGIHRQSVQSRQSGGVKEVDVDDNGRKIHVTTQADGSIEMSVTGVEDGKEVTETYRAKDADDLKRDNPEAFALFDQWAGNGRASGMHISVGPLGIGRPFGLIAPNAAIPVPPAAADPKARRDQLEEQLKAANVPPEQIDQIVGRLKAAEEARHRAEQDAEQRVHDRLRGHTSDGGATVEKPDATQPASPQTQPK